MNSNPAADLVIASPWRRVVALLIDALTIVVVGVALDIILFGSDTHERESLALAMILTAIYQITFLISKSATPGKTAMGLSVVDREGHALRPDTAILRYVVYFIGGTIGVGTLASIILVVVDKERRTVHDRIAGTRVIMGRPREVSARDRL